MDLKLKMRFVELGGRFLKGDLTHLCPYPFTPYKAPFASQKGQPLPFARPEDTGLAPSLLEKFFRGLEKQNGVLPHAALVMRRGRVIAEGYWAPYAAQYPHDLYSLSKSFTGTAVGMAVEEGYFTLEDRLQDIFPDKFTAFSRLTKKPITIKNLLDRKSVV